MKSLLTILLLSISLHAQELSLNQAINEGLESSPVLLKAKSQKEEISWKKVEAYSGFLPTVSANVNYLTKHKYLLTDVQLSPGAPVLSIPGIVPTSNATVTAQLPIFDGFGSTNRLLSARSFEKSAENDFDWAKFQLERQIILQYFKTLAAQTLQQTAKQNVETLEDHLKDVQLFKKAGVSTNYDVLRVEVQVSEARSELMNATDNAEISRLKLAELLGKESEDRSVSGKLPVLPSDLVQKLDLSQIGKRKDLIGLQEKAQAFHYLENASAAYWVPKVALFGQYQYYNNISEGFNDRDNYREAYQMGVSLNWNIFDGAVSTAKSKQSIEQRYQADKNLRLAQLKAKQDLEIWKRKFNYFNLIYKSRLGDVEKSSESVRLAREGRKVGVRTNTELLDAETELFRAKAGAINAQLGSIEALINLELALGFPIYSFNQ